MAFQDMRKNRDNPTTSSTTVGGVGTLTAFIDQGSEFTGKLSFKDTVRIDGHFEGEISSENTLVIGESGSVHASIRSQVVIVSGEIQGDIIAGQQVTLHKTARILGNVKTEKLVIEEGAELNGKIEMGKGKGKEALTEPSPPGPSKADAGKDKGPLSPGQRN